MIAGAFALAAGCGGPDTAIVTNIVDGDTVDLDTGIRIRYLMIDTPESTGGATDCFGQNAKTFNSDLHVGFSNVAVMAQRKASASTVGESTVEG